jgi:azurin
MRTARWLNQVSELRVFTLALLLGALAWWPSARAATAPEVIRIGTLPGLRYDTNTFSVRPGVEVELVFSNFDDMLHNFVITRPGARERVVQAALALGQEAADRNFVPPSRDVLWSTKLVPTGQSATLRFTAPSTLGNYPFVCTMPGHGVLMFGTMTVTRTPRPPVMTPVEPPTDASHGAHAPTTHPAVIRGFMPEAGPASIAVELAGGISYVWDAGAGRFRYAWIGGIPTMPSSPERRLATVPGKIFYREPAFPLRVGATANAAPKLMEFNGYTIDAARVPEFETVVDGVTVRERIEVKDGKLARRFRLTGPATVWFAVPEGVTGLEIAGATREGAFYKLTGAAAQDFTVTYAIPPS